MRKDEWDIINRREKKAAAAGRYFKARWYQARHWERWAQKVLLLRKWTISR